MESIEAHKEDVADDPTSGRLRAPTIAFLLCTLVLMVSITSDLVVFPVFTIVALINAYLWSWIDPRWRDRTRDALIISSGSLAIVLLWLGVIFARTNIEHAVPEYRANLARAGIVDYVSGFPIRATRGRDWDRSPPPPGENVMVSSWYGPRSWVFSRAQMSRGIWTAWPNLALLWLACFWFIKRYRPRPTMGEHVTLQLLAFGFCVAGVRCLDSYFW